ncbi:GH1 family beta-glucosidase [Streptomyces rubiginosohelvolus]|uniref:GH1 family beta-glucosidase n=1 Tax=Streptomyces rubiginosohelvolus TaxID=67362 RepID=UPI0036D857F9
MQFLHDFPTAFRWGVATSAYQIEGATAADGRGRSIWDTLCEVPGAVEQGENGDTACDHYHRWAEDIEVMRELGVSDYRFSISWPRVVPGDDGVVNRAGLAFYDRLVDGLLEAGIRPYATLYHWDLPQALQDRGGWPERATAERFGEYAAAVAETLGDRVQNWATLNEPYCAAWLGHLEGRHAPGLTDLTAAVQASYHLLLGHGLAAQALRANSARTPDVGIAVNLSPCEPATDSDADRDAARRADGHHNRWWLDPVHGRGFPTDMREVYGVDLPERPGDAEIIAAPLDHIGVNYYFRQIVADAPARSAPSFDILPVPGSRTTAMGWEVHPEGLERTLVRLHEEYAPASIVITENGSAQHDVVGADGTVHDPQRIDFLERHLEACASAVRRGVPLHGYYAWSLMDNFEWNFGYGKRFGLVHVDYATQRRTLKTSGRRFAQLIDSHRKAAAPA